MTTCVVVSSNMPHSAGHRVQSPNNYTVNDRRGSKFHLTSI